MKKKTVKQYILWALLVCLVAGLAVMPLLAAKEEAEEGPQASILSATAAVGSMEAVLRGGGVLSPVDSQTVTLPEGVKITEFLVDNGDTVSAGDPVAKVDRVSVMQTVLSVRDTMSHVQKQIADAENDTVSATVRAAAGGRVKQIFAKAGDSVEAVMLEHGALAVLSLDGMMAVRLEGQTGLRAGRGLPPHTRGSWTECHRAAAGWSLPCRNRPRSCGPGRSRRFRQWRWPGCPHGLLPGAG